jgi:hypothetical protein
MADKKRKIIQPGTIVCFPEANVDGPLYGISLPKDKFLDLFRGEKGEWPIYEDKPSDEKNLTNRFGHFIININSSAVLRLGEFLNNDFYIGVKYFGKVFDRFIGRAMSLEIAQESTHQAYSIKDLGIVWRTMSNTLNGLQACPNVYGRIMSEFQIVTEFFSGKYAEHATEDLFPDIANRYVTDMIEIYRHCGFPEDGSALECKCE